DGEEAVAAVVADRVVAAAGRVQQRGQPLERAVARRWRLLDVERLDAVEADQQDGAGGAGAPGAGQLALDVVAQVTPVAEVAQRIEARARAQRRLEPGGVDQEAEQRRDLLEQRL